MFLSLLLVNIVLGILFKLYLKLTCGICECSRHLVGKVALVTGGTAGIGYETAKNLAERGAKVIVASRDENRGKAARDSIIVETGNHDVHFKKLDLASFRSVREFAKDILQIEQRLDILINNAGALGLGYKKTEDGLLVGMQINHFGPFLLTNLLLPLLKSSAPSRIINVSSMAYSHGKIDFQNLDMEKETEKTFSEIAAYSNSKLCNVLMTVELSRRLENTGVTTNSLHPGAVSTEIGKHIANPFYKYLLWIAMKLFYKSAWEGAQTSIYLATSPEGAAVTGRYFSDCMPKKTSQLAQDKDLARKLWEESERIVQLKK